MAFVVETGAGLSNANSYASVAAANAYYTERGNTSWGPLTTTAKEAALIKATDYLEAVYRSAWKGYRVGAAQALSWPRTGVIVDGFPVADNVVPNVVVNACIEMALRANDGELLADQGQRIVREKVDVIETEYAEYSDPTERYPSVSRALAPYLYSPTSDAGFSQVRIIRT